MGYDELFRTLQAGGHGARLATVQTSEGNDRFILGTPFALSDEELRAIGTSVPTLSSVDQRVIGTHGFLDFERGTANGVEINGAQYSFPVYVIRHLAVPPQARGQGHGMKLLETIAALARKEHRHLAGNPSSAGQGLREEFSKHERGIVWYREAENPMMLTLLKYNR